MIFVCAGGLVAAGLSAVVPMTPVAADAPQAAAAPPALEAPAPVLPETLVVHWYASVRTREYGDLRTNRFYTIHEREGIAAMYEPGSRAR